MGTKNTCGKCGLNYTHQLGCPNGTQYNVNYIDAEIAELLNKINTERGTLDIKIQGHIYLSVENSIYNIMKRNFMPGGGETLRSFGSGIDALETLKAWSK